MKAENLEPGRQMAPKPVDPALQRPDESPLRSRLKLDNSHAVIAIESGKDDLSDRLSRAAQLCEPK